MQRRIAPLLLALLMFCAFALPAFAEGTEGTEGTQGTIDNGQQKVVLIQGSNKMYRGGSMIVAAQPLQNVKGATFAAARSLLTELGATIKQDAKTKQYVVSNGVTELRFTVGRAAFSQDGAAKQAAGAPYVLKGTLMLPVKTVALSFGITLTAIPKEKKIELVWSEKPIAKFTASTTTPYATQTDVTYADLSFHPRGLAIVDERWENDLPRFDQPGTYQVTHWVQDERGIWSDPYTVIITVKPPNQPPVASFTTDKDTYKMGEYINYNDYSSDDENRIANVEWTNNAKAFFEPGTHTVTLKVTDANGAVGELSKTLTITNETLYTRDEFNLIYSAFGDKYAINGSDILSYAVTNPTLQVPQDNTLIRSNSPETITQEGIYYADEVSGDVRFLIHNYNVRPTPVKIYILATNPNATNATVTVGAVGVGGPNPFVSSVGSAVTGRYLEAKVNEKFKSVVIPAGKTQVLIPEYFKEMKTGDVFSLVADMRTDSNLKMQVVVADANRNILSYLPFLNPLASNDAHVRGTFYNANRIMYVNDPIGGVKSRMVFGDNIVDPRLNGYDKLSDKQVTNAGNYGTLYKIFLNNVQPHTAIIVNARGGHYAGAFSVNGKSVYLSNGSILLTRDEAGMLYRTGESVEQVEIVFTPASGSNLPINLLFVPMPEIRA